MYGYEALFDMRSGEALQLQQYTGLKVYIHSQHEPPGSGSSFLLSPGFYYYVKMDMQEVSLKTQVVLTSFSFKLVLSNGPRSLRDDFIVVLDLGIF